MRFVLPGNDDTIKSLFAEKLILSTQHPDVREETSFYQLEGDVTYLAGMMSMAIKLKEVDLDSMGYWLAEAPKVIEDMNGVQAQAGADKILVSLAIRKSFPRGCPEYTGVGLGQRLYRVASVFHPDKSLHPCFALLSLNFPAWVRALPYFSRELSLLISAK